MSASVELLAEQIRDIERKLNEPEPFVGFHATLRKTHSELMERLNVSNAALNEGRQILKGL